MWLWLMWTPPQWSKITRARNKTTILRIQYVRSGASPLKKPRPKATRLAPSLTSCLNAWNPCPSTEALPSSSAWRSPRFGSGRAYGEHIHKSRPPTLTLKTPSLFSASCIHGCFEHPADQHDPLCQGWEKPNPGLALAFDAVFRAVFQGATCWAWSIMILYDFVMDFHTTIPYYLA